MNLEKHDKSVPDLCRLQLQTDITSIQSYRVDACVVVCECFELDEYLDKYLCK